MSNRDDEEKPVNRFVNQLLEENYNLKLSIDNFKEVKQELKEILKSLETSCKFDESMKYDQFNMEEPERARYEDLKMCRDKLRRILV